MRFVFHAHFGFSVLQGHQHALGKGLEDLESTREDVVLEVLNAPKRRIDNEITRLTDAVRLLHMHLTIVDDLSKKFRAAQFRARAMVLGLGAVSGSAVIGAVLAGMPPEILGALVAIGGGGVGSLSWWQSKIISELSTSLISDDTLNATFRKVYGRQLANKDEGVSACWVRVHEHLILSLTSTELRNFDKISSADLSMIENIIEVEIPNLRRMAAPAFNKTL